MAHQLAGDPVSRGSSLLLALAAGMALLVAAVAVVLLVSGDRRDDAGELHAWESDGVRPATLRRMLLIRALSVVAVGIPIGLAAGLLLAHVGANVVAVDASGATPEPPLHVQVGPLWSSVLLAIGLGLAVGIAALVAGLALRERLPVPPDVELR
jgi:ABC-type antimicrobial peptide transport system permease subunit